MAGERVLPIDVCPDLRAHTIVINVPATAFDNNAYDGAFLFYAERDTIIDAAHVICAVIDADGDLTLSTASGAASAGGVPSAGTAISDTIVPAAAGVVKAFTLTETANLIPAGNWVAIEHANDGDSEDLLGVMVQLRVRTIRK